MIALPTTRAQWFALEALVREHNGFPELITRGDDVDVVGVRGDLLAAGDVVVLHLVLDVFGDDLVPVDTGSRSLMARSWHHGDPAELEEVDPAADPHDVVAYCWFQLVPERAFSGQDGRWFVPTPSRGRGASS